VQARRISADEYAELLIKKIARLFRLMRSHIHSQVKVGV
jgi:hypothetical protein